MGNKGVQDQQGSETTGSKHYNFSLILIKICVCINIPIFPEFHGQCVRICSPERKRNKERLTEATEKPLSIGHPRE